MRNTLSWAEIRHARKSIQEVARREGVTLEEVRANITEAIKDMRADPNPGPRAKWAGSPFSDREPSPEEFVAWCARRVREKQTEMPHQF